MRKRRQVYYMPKNTDSEGQKWLAGVLNLCGVSQSELADRLHTTRQSVCKLLNGQTKMTFCKVVAVCYVCGLTDDPEAIWHSIEQN